ncbi:MAG: hypothetical protein U5M53_01180 [Rhodoferax sp.]|nr:hypothetical protein [Rhodoferax sp.]
MENQRQAEAAFEHFAHSDAVGGDDAMLGRKLHRAAYCLHYLLVRRDGAMQAFNLDRAQSQTLGKDQAILNYIGKCLDALTGKNVTPITPPQQAAATLVQPAIQPAIPLSPSPALLKFQNAVKNVVTIRKQRITAFQQVGRDILARDKSANVAIRTDAGGLSHWLQAINDIRHHYSEQTHNSLFNFTAMTSATNAAYEQFSLIVKEGQKETSSKLEMASLCFTALSKAPLPLSLIGTIGGLVTKALHVDGEINQKREYEVLEGEADTNVKKIANWIKEGINGKKEGFKAATRLGFDLKNLPPANDLQTALQTVARSHLLLMQGAVGSACDQVFGDDEASRTAQFEAFAEHIKNTRVPGKLQARAEQQQLISIIHSEMKEIKRSATEAIDKVLNGARPTLVGTDCIGAFELLLYGVYIDRFFKIVGSSGYDYSRDLPDAIIERLSEKSTPWAVLMPKSTKAEAQGARRLKWGGEENHKRALNYFFQWYLREMNPFLIVAGATHAGHPMTVDYIKQQMGSYIDKLNAAIIANARKEHFYSISTTWNWSGINSKLGLN